MVIFGLWLCPGPCKPQCKCSEVSCATYCNHVYLKKPFVYFPFPKLFVLLMYLYLDFLPIHMKLSSGNLAEKCDYIKNFIIAIKPLHLKLGLVNNPQEESQAPPIYTLPGLLWEGVAWDSALGLVTQTISHCRA